VIDGARAKAHVDFLADPARGGRFTGSAGYNAAAAYVADQLKSYGVEPKRDLPKIQKDDVEKLKQAYLPDRDPSHRVYGPKTRRDVTTVDSGSMSPSLLRT